MHKKKSYQVSIVEHLDLNVFSLIISPPQGYFTSYDFFDFYSLKINRKNSANLVRKRTYLWYNVSQLYILYSKYLLSGYLDTEFLAGFVARAKNTTLVISLLKRNP